MTTHDFTVLNSELLVDAPIIGLRRDEVSMPGGGSAHREIVEHFGAVAVVAEREGEIAMVNQYRRSVNQRLWELPAGLLDIAEEDPLTCARRELEEEAGLAAQHWELLSDLFTSPGICDEAVRIYLARELREVPRPPAEHEEADLIFNWVPIEKARAMVMSGEINNAIAITGIMTAAEVLAGRAVARPADTSFPQRPEALAQRRIAAGRVPDMKKL
ncbi:ADP-ribose pyrophosphatase [Corynebacterium occultum]|uniref:ADP-ribose pyrophosphatase n=1 Tax=Corynebacterium occultum TaxID=2675219 RepID=A0A6B8W7L9_9CORY|nr:NUDIX hydrolase [Corynebacterium occultum]QGU07295.1 ADP-ribose pyrophosphatase [Corynebacterium occultum]